MIIKIIQTLLLISLYLTSSQVLGQDTIVEETLNEKATTKEIVESKSDTLDKVKIPGELEKESANNPPEVGKHVMANMNAGNMILSLLMVLVLIVICAYLLKRFNFAQQGGVSPLKVVTSLSLGAKERVIVVQVGEQQLLLGVTAQQITLLEKLTEPLVQQSATSTELPKNLLSFLATKKL
jgi:flagellar protein FliO/FliZ